MNHDLNNMIDAVEGIKLTIDDLNIMNEKRKIKLQNCHKLIKELNQQHQQVQNNSKIFISLLTGFASLSVIYYGHNFFMQKSLTFENGFKFANSVGAFGVCCRLLKLSFMENKPSMSLFEFLKFLLFMNKEE